MDEKVMIEEIVKVFNDKTKEYSNKLNTENYTTKACYIKNDIEKGYNFVDAILEFKNFFLKLEYRIHTIMTLPKSVLEMRIVFKGGKFPIEYSIYDLLNIIDKTNFNSYTIPYITTPEIMKRAIDYLLETFENYKERIEELFQNELEFKQLEENVTEQINIIIGRDIFKTMNIEYVIHMLEVYYILDSARFTSDIYANYVLIGKYKKAIKLYNRARYKMTLYEERLKDYLSSLKEAEMLIPNELDNLKHVKKYKKVGFKQSILTLISFLVLSSIWSALYSLIYLITHILVTKGSIYASNSEYTIVIILGIVTAMVNLFFTRNFVSKIAYGKKYEDYIRVDTLLNGQRITSYITKLFQFVIAACIAFSLLAANTYISFNENSIVLKDDYFNLKGEEIAYEKIDSIYKVDKILDELIGEIENTNYVILLKDNTKIELYWFLTTEEVEEKVLPILKEKEIEIKTIDIITNIKDVEEID